jgi:transketolase
MAEPAVKIPAAREAYRDELLAMLPDDPRLVCLDTDTGLFAGVDFASAAERYVDVGIGEQNLMGMAAGLAASGFIPFVNTMAAFASTRALEAVKIDIAYNNLPVRIMATHGGLAAGHLGPTHQALEDLAVMRALPNMTVVVPADPAATRSVVRQSVDLPGPLYVRMGRKATPPLPRAVPAPRIGEAQLLRDGQDVLVVCCGPHPVLAAHGAAALLDAEGVRCAVLNMHTLKPLDITGLASAAAGKTLVVTVEEHWRSGGLGDAVSDALSGVASARVVRLGVPDTFSTTVGGHAELLDEFGINAAGVASVIRRALDPSTRPGWTTSDHPRAHPVPRAQ